jgi:hypothetical protein
MPPQKVPCGLSLGDNKDGEYFGGFNLEEAPAIALLNRREGAECFILSFRCQSSDVLHQIQS